MSDTIIMGAVAYDPKAVTIWEAIKELFRDAKHPLDFVLYSSYEAQVDALFRGHVDIAWNTNVAWLRTQRRSKGTARALAMRDTDVGFTTKLIARAGSGVTGLESLRGKTVALGSRDSAQAAILPVELLRRAGLVVGEDVKALRFDVDVGKHGDTGTSELEVLKALRDGRAQGGIVGESTWAMLLSTGAVDPKAIEAVWTSPPYLHCNFTALATLPESKAKAFTDTLFAMDYAEPACRKMMDLEGLKKWVPGQTAGYAMLEEAMDRQGLFG